MAKVWNTIWDAALQLQTARNFWAMTADTEKYSESERKGFVRMAFMHAKVAATIIACVDDSSQGRLFNLAANNDANDYGYILELLMDGQTVEQVRAVYFRYKAERESRDKELGLRVDNLDEFVAIAARMS